MQGVSVIRVGTQVVVRLDGDVDDGQAPRLEAALAEIAAVALNRVLVDCSCAGRITGAGLRFIELIDERWRLRLVDPPAEIRAALRRSS